MSVVRLGPDINETYEVIFEPDDLQIDNQVILSDIEEKSFHYGIICGLKETNDYPVFFAKITREILEFLYSNVSYDMISVFEKKRLYH